jgi:hypothetical protein
VRYRFRKTKRSLLDKVLALPAQSKSAPLFSAKGAVGASQFLLPLGEGLDEDFSPFRGKLLGEMLSCEAISDSKNV